jgi:hypothetical protein
VKLAKDAQVPLVVMVMTTLTRVVFPTVTNRQAAEALVNGPGVARKRREEACRRRRFDRYRNSAAGTNALSVMFRLLGYAAREAAYALSDS